MNKQITEIELSKIDLDTAQPRGESKVKQLQELAKDIQERGQLYPILVTPYIKEGEKLILGKKALESKKSRWWILDGERRTRATKLLKKETIEAIIKLDLEFLEMLEIQFASNTKRVQITVEEMAKAVKRFKKEYLKTNPKGDPIKRLVELTGYSSSYFDMAEAINRSSKDFQEKIFEGKIGGYAASEIEKSTKDKSLRKGVASAYVKSEKPISALGVRAIKHDLRKIEKKKLPEGEKEHLAESLMDSWANRHNEEEDESSDFIRYQYEVENFFDEIKKWNLKDITYKQMSELLEAVNSIKEYFTEERRKIGKLRTKKKSKNI